MDLNQPDRSEFRRLAFGQNVPLGTLYDARLDQFLPASFLHPLPPGESPIATEPRAKFSTTTCFGAKHATRFDALGLDHNVAASVMSGLVEPKGSTTFLGDGAADENSLCGAVSHTSYTCREFLTLNDPGFMNYINTTALRDHFCTHLVVAVDWGIRNIMTIRHHIVDQSQIATTKERFRSDLDELEIIAKSIYSTDFTDDSVSSRLKLNHDLKLYTESQRNSGIYQQTLSIMCRFAQLETTHNHRKGYPLEYSLLPIALLCRIVPGLHTVPVPNPSFNLVSDVGSFMDLFDEFNESKEKLEEYRRDLRGKEQYLARDHIQAVDDAINLLETSYERVRADLREILVGVRSGTASPHDLQSLHSDVVSSAFFPKRISIIAGQQRDKIAFVDNAVSAEATYIGFNGLSLNNLAMPRGGPIPYVFDFNNAVLKSSCSWNDQQSALMELLWSSDGSKQVFIVDRDAPSVQKNVEAAHLGAYSGNTEAMPGTFEEHETPGQYRPPSVHRPSPADAPVEEEEECIARCDQLALDTSDANRPIKRRLVKIPCPGRRCDSRLRQEWICADCHLPIEFGFVDDFIYCDCGRSIYNAWEFKCNSRHHGSDFDRYSSRDLHRLLRRLDQSGYRNILILGETGVGKSSFINAFVNYLKFKTLNEAKAFGELVWVVPCSFAATGDPYGGLEKTVIRVGGQQDDERDGIGGDSATQKTSVYPVNHGKIMYRLIDTPGIGDTEGPAKDKKNMQDILDTLSSYEELHGILILLTTNQPRLTATFRFCFEELLSHIHRSAVANIAFGFTHSRDSRFTPGDSCGPLTRLLSKHPDVQFTLSRSTAYCFDSESFRYLAAYHGGHRLPGEESYRESWDRSREEALRLLRHFDEIKPHDVNQTLSMNGARRAISQLMVPMVEVSQMIRHNIAALDDKLKELEDTRLSGRELRKRLHLDMIQFSAKQLDMPRTVCKHKNCCDFKENGRGELMTIYKTHCHAECRLPDIKQDCVGAPGLIKCRAFKNNKRSCSHCKHHWQDHMHVLYELKESKVKVKDSEIERRLNSNEDDVRLRQAGIDGFRKRQQEYTYEHQQLREATARFVAYLKQHAITPVNDATKEYFEMLIDQEKTKIQVGRDQGVNVDSNRKKLNGLKEDLLAHVELTEMIKQNMHAPRSRLEECLTKEDIEKLVDRLYHLEHFGKKLKELRDIMTSSHNATYRERPYRVRRSRPQRTGHGHVGRDEGVRFVPERAAHGRGTEDGGRRRDWGIGSWFSDGRG
ncbi:hypothetical protein F66182_2347 [Fusarium sp. NRRL 66182]|nr:hypothetical protein F66182_2347 [Fusarium sp. NRRL 66182]